MDCKECSEELSPRESQACAQCGDEVHASGCMEYICTLRGRYSGDPGSCYPEEGIDVCRSCYEQRRANAEDAAERRAEEMLDRWRDR